MQACLQDWGPRSEGTEKFGPAFFIFCFALGVAGLGESALQPKALEKGQGQGAEDETET